MTLQVTVHATAPLQALARLAVQLGNLSVPNKALAAKLTAWVDRNFQTSGSLVGGWAPLGPMSIRQKTARRWSLQPLLTTGAALTLQRSFLAFYDQTRVGIGSEIPYSIHHQTGVASTRGRVVGKQIPKREMLPSKAQALDMAINVYGFYITRAKAQAGIP